MCIPVGGLLLLLLLKWDSFPHVRMHCCVPHGPVGACVHGRGNPESFCRTVGVETPASLAARVLFTAVSGACCGYCRFRVYVEPGRFVDIPGPTALTAARPPPVCDRQDASADRSLYNDAYH